MKTRITIKLLLLSLVVLAGIQSPVQAASFSQSEQDRYMAGYRRGVVDGRSQQHHQFVDAFVRAGYERGLHESAQAAQQTPEKSAQERSANVPNANEPVQNEGDVADEPSYNFSQPTTKQKEFFTKLGPLAVKVCRQFDLYPSILLAQAALESNWGSSELASRYCNLMGVKAIAGLPSVSMMTSEQDHSGHSYQVKAAFRKYKDWQESLEDYANVLETEQFRLVHRHQSEDYHQALKALRGNYASDVHYDQKLETIIKAFDLTKYDAQVATQHDAKRGGQFKQQSFMPKAHRKEMSVKSHQSKARPAKRKSHVWIMSVAGGLASLALLKVKQLHR